MQRPPRCHPPWFRLGRDFKFRDRVRKRPVRASLIRKKKRKSSRAWKVLRSRVHSYIFQLSGDFEIWYPPSVYTWSKISSRRASKFLFRVATQQRVENRTVPFGGRFAERCLLALKEGGKGSRLSVFFFFLLPLSNDRKSFDGEKCWKGDKIFLSMSLKHGKYDKFITVFIIINWNYFEYTKPMNNHHLCFDSHPPVFLFFFLTYSHITLISLYHVYVLDSRNNWFH